jgi:hypothetical protein
LVQFHRPTGIARVVAIAGPQSQSLTRSLSVVKRLFPSFDVPGVAFHSSANDLARAAYQEGRVVNAPVEELAEGILRSFIVSASIRLGGFKYGVVCPIKSDGAVVGAVAFHTRKHLDPRQVEACTKLVNDLVLTWQNGRLTETLRQAAEAERTGMASEGELRFGNLLLDMKTKTASAGTRRLSLTPFEFNLLAYLVQRPDKSVPLDDLTREVLGSSDRSVRSIADLTMESLRQKLEADGSARLIHFSRGKGYMLRQGKLP